MPGIFYILIVIKEEEEDKVAKIQFKKDGFKKKIDQLSSI